MLHEQDTVCQLNELGPCWRTAPVLSHCPSWQFLCHNVVLSTETVPTVWQATWDTLCGWRAAVCAYLSAPFRSAARTEGDWMIANKDMQTLRYKRIKSRQSSLFKNATMGLHRTGEALIMTSFGMLQYCENSLWGTRRRCENAKEEGDPDKEKKKKRESVSRCVFSTHIVHYQTVGFWAWRVWFLFCVDW